MTISFNGTAKTITLSTGTTELDVLDLWSRAVDWWLTSDNSKYEFPMQEVGGNDIDVGAGISIPIYIFLDPAWTIVPQNANHTLYVTGGILLVEGGGDPFSSVAGRTVRIVYQQPVQAIGVAGGSGGGLTADQVRAAVWSDDDQYANGEKGNDLKKVLGLTVGNS